MSETEERAVRARPRGYWGDVRDQMYSILRLCWEPMRGAAGGPCPSRLALLTQVP